MKQLYVIGMGPGGADQLTPQARLALEESQVLCGYTTYLDLAREFQEGRVHPHDPGAGALPPGSGAGGGG